MQWPLHVINHFPPPSPTERDQGSRHMAADKHHLCKPWVHFLALLLKLCGLRPISQPPLALAVSPVKACFCGEKNTEQVKHPTWGNDTQNVVKKSTHYYHNFYYERYARGTTISTNTSFIAFQPRDGYFPAHDKTNLPLSFLPWNAIDFKWLKTNRFIIFNLPTQSHVDEILSRHLLYWLDCKIICTANPFPLLKYFNRSPASISNLSEET